jgi:tetratricopeptide (TPR) repeat protein
VALLNEAGRFNDAVNIMENEETLKSREAILGSGHTSTIFSMVNLMLTYIKLARWNDARVLGNKALERAENSDSLGPEHSIVLTIRRYFVILLLEQGKLHEAEKEATLALDVHENILGPDNQSTLEIMCLLADIKARLGNALWGLKKLNRKRQKLQEAEKMAWETRAKCSRLLGETHMSTIFATGILVRAAFPTRLPSDVYQFDKLALDTLCRSRDVLGHDHPQTIELMDNISSACATQRRFYEASHLTEQSIEEKIRIFGLQHRYTLSSQAHLVQMYNGQGRWAEAEKLAEEVAKSYEELGYPCSEGLINYMILTVLHMFRGSFFKAILSFRMFIRYAFTWTTFHYPYLRFPWQR